MGEKWSASYHLVASAGAEGFVTIATVPDGKVLNLTLVKIAYPVGTYGELKNALYYGNMQVVPDEGMANGDNLIWRKVCSVRFFSGDPLRFYYKNENATETRECYVELEGELS